MTKREKQAKKTEDSSGFSEEIGPLTPWLLKAFADNRLILDCPEIILTQNVQNDAEIIRGRGMISLLGASEFQLRMYADSGTDGLKELKELSKWVSGELIPEDQYFGLEATDVNGLLWEWEKVLIKRNGLESVVISAKFHALKQRSRCSPSSAAMTLYFFDELDVAYNELVKTTTKTGKQKALRSSGFRAATAEAGGFRISVRKVPAESGSTILHLRSRRKKTLPRALEYRTLEALRYVTFRPVLWCISEKRDQGIREVVISPRQQVRSTLFDAPLPHDHPHHWQDFWNLFSAYFKHVINYGDSVHYHPLSAQVHPLISSETRDLGVLSLLVSVAVEGVLNTEFEHVAKPSKELVEAIEQAKVLVDRVKCSDESLKARVKGSLQQMKRSRAKDKLKRMKDIGVITKGMYDAWDALRNASAHAAIDPESVDTQKLWTRCLTVYTLLNILIFTTVGYSGQYIDFSTSNWPRIKFNLPSEL